MTRFAQVGLFALLLCPFLSEQLRGGDSDVITPTSGILLQGLPSRTGEQLPADPVEAELIRRGDRPLKATPGAAVALGDKSLRWEQVPLNERGGFDQPSDRRGGAWLYVPIESDRDKVVLLCAGGYELAYVNGVPRGGNMYAYPYVRLPVKLHTGTNELLLRLSWRAPLRIRLEPPPQSVILSDSDSTLPDFAVGEPVDAPGTLLLINASERPVTDLRLTCVGEGLEEFVISVPVILPLSLRKVPFRLRGPARESEGSLPLSARLTCSGNPLLDAAHTFTLRVRRPDQNIRRTFISDIDGSVQYYGLRQATPLSADDPPPAIVLSCHGASVEGIKQAGSYPAKSWLHLVAPTNRRPYGYDWEDFGRADALEVLDIAQRTLPHDRSRIYLTGHSMGGHGTWHIGATFPDRFAALGPSAGWVSYNLYRRDREHDTPGSPIEEILCRGNIASDTLALAANLKQHGIYVVHGADDDNVPAKQSQLMAETLESFHRDWFYHELPGKRHWWSNELADGGAACMDWPEMYDMFARHALPPQQSVRRVEFITANPGVSSECHWLAIEAQQRQQHLSRVDVMTWPNARRFEGTTENVARLRLETAHLRSDGPITVTLDGQVLDDVSQPTGRAPLWLERTGEQWSVSSPPSPNIKGPHRYGATKSELRNRFLFVYGTQGNEEENRWTFAKARFDAETYWYRGNASVDFVADVDFDAKRFADRTVVLYGNAETNSAWEPLLRDSPVQVTRRAVRIGDRELAGDDLAAMFLRPRADSDRASVIAIGGTGPAGIRACQPLSLFLPFTRYPDLAVVRAPADSEARSPLLVAGYFGLDWSIENGEIEWNEDAGSTISD